MRFAADVEVISGLGAVVAQTVTEAGPVDLTSLSAAIGAGLPGSLSASLSGIVADVQHGLQRALAELELDGGRLRLAAEQYAAADRVVAAAGGHARTPALTPGLSGESR